MFSCASMYNSRIMNKQKHCIGCNSLFEPTTAWQKFCNQPCKTAYRWRTTRNGRATITRHCRQCGTQIEITNRDDANRYHCSEKCSAQSARESRSKFFKKNPRKAADYYAKTLEKLGPDGNLRRFYARHPNAPHACQSCGESRVLDIAHRPNHSRNGAWRSVENTSPEKVWILCPTCHALLDRMHYPPSDLGLK